MKENLVRWRGVFSPKLVHGCGGFYKNEEAEENLGTPTAVTTTMWRRKLYTLSFAPKETGAKSTLRHGAHREHGGLSRDDSLPIFRYLTEHLTQDQFVTRFTWRQGSLLCGIIAACFITRSTIITVTGDTCIGSLLRVKSPVIESVRINKINEEGIMAQQNDAQQKAAILQQGSMPYH